MRVCLVVLHKRPQGLTSIPGATGTATLIRFVLRRVVPPGALALLVGTAAAASATAGSSPERLPATLDVAANGHVVLARRPGNTRMHVDGVLDEPEWDALEVHEDFRLIDPDTLRPGKLPTRLRMFYTDRGLYLGVEMAQPAETLVEHLSGRDQGFLNRDYFSFTLDTSGEGRYGFWFQLNLGNSVSDGTILPERQYSQSWDGAWRGATARTEEGWSAEYFIPWSLVNMPRANGTRTIGIFAQRNVAYADERYAWPPLPWTKPKFLSEFVPLALRDVSPRQQVSVTPYVSASYDRFAGADPVPKAGVDLFWRPSSNLQLTSTLNPDFGNVEADDVIVNLGNYETFFPEKRLFFQEGQEVFTTNGRMFGDVRLLHTRRIGGPARLPETAPGVSLAGSRGQRPADLLGALKATGQSGAFRYGFLGAAEDDTDFDAFRGDTPIMLRQEGRRFGAMRLLYERANGDYRALGLLTTSVQHPQRRAVVHGVDSQYVSPQGQWHASTQLIQADIDGGADGMGGFVDLKYTPRQGLTHTLSLDAFDDAIDLSDLGYLRRNDYRRVNYRMRLSAPGVAGFRDTRTQLRFDRMWNTAGKVVGAEVSFDQRLILRNLSQIRVSGGLRPGRYDDRASFGNGIFRIDDSWEVELRYYSDSSRRLAYSVRQRWTQEPAGGLAQRTQGFLRWRPTDRITMGLGLRYVEREAWLLHRAGGDFTAYAANELMPNFDLSYFFTARQQLRMAFQWVAIDADERRFFRMPAEPGLLLPRTKENSAGADDFAISRMNMQLRYRWEIAPLSDLFVVYTRNAAAPYADAVGQGFGDLFARTLAETTGENLVLKLRYRFGS